MKVELGLFTAFFRIGLFTFGGGYSMLPMLEREVVDRHSWAARDELLDYFAIGQCTPGIIAVNTATMVGYRQCGFWGSLLATLGVISPSLVIITAIAAVLSNFAHIPAVINAFAGIRVAVCALILSAVIRLFKSNVLQKNEDGSKHASLKPFLIHNAIPFLLCFSAFFVVAILDLSPVYAVIGAAAFGMLFYGNRGDA